MEADTSSLIFAYRYRDAGNFKVEGRILLIGHLDSRKRAAILDKMESEKFFVAEQVGLPSLCSKLFEFGGGPTAEDHAWHEFDSFQAATINLRNSSDEVIMSAKTLHQAFVDVDTWQPELSPNFALGRRLNL